MVIEVYGKKDCTLCESAKKKLAMLLKKWELQDSVEVDFMDMETEYGAAEGDFHDVFDIPSVLLKGADDRVLGRWDGKPPSSDELGEKLAVKTAA